MWQFVNSRITALKHVAGVTLWITHEGYDVSAIILKQEKGIVKVDRQISSLDFETLLDELKAQQFPVALHIDGRGILHRAVEKNSGHSGQDLLNIVMPNAKAGEFHIQTYDGSEKSHVSVMRKDLLQTILESFASKGIDVIQIYLGPFVAARICPASADTLQSLIVKGWSLSFNNNLLTQVQPLTNTVQDSELTLKGGEQLTPAAKLPYAAALSTLIYKEDSEFSFYSTSVTSLRVDWEQKRLFQRSFKIALALVFLILFINTIFFIQGSIRNEQLTFEAQRNETTFSRLESLTEEISRKKKFIAETAWGDFPRAAFYADRLAASVPEKIWLTEINIHPMDEKILKSDRKQLFKNKLIQIKGKSGDPMLINEWIKALGSQDWILKITNQEFEYSAHERTGIFSFHIQIR